MAAPDRSDFPLREWMAFEIDTGDRSAVASLDVDDRHLNPNGVVHGAVMFALVDTAMGGATMDVVPDGAFCATIDVSVRFLAPCHGGRLLATATVRRAGRRIVHLDGSIHDGDGHEYAAATGAFAVLGA